MMDCKQFEQFQISSLLGEETAGDRKSASIHKLACGVCNLTTRRDRQLAAAFELQKSTAESGFPKAHKKIEKFLDEHRVFCCQMEGPFGTVYLARTTRGLVRLSFRNTEQNFIDELSKRELLPELAPGKLSREIKQLREYFSGRCKSFHFPTDLRLATSFQQLVLKAAAGIPFGTVVSYSDIARHIGRPTARRAVGNALGRNPIAIVIPCHRVVAADGSIGGYTGGLDIKRSLMHIEGINASPEIKSRK